MRVFIVLVLTVLISLCTESVTAGELTVKKGKKDKIGLVDGNGKFVVKAEYDEITDFIDGIAMLRKGDKWGLVNSNGRIVAPVKYASIKGFNKYGLAQVNLGGKLESGIVTGGKLGYVNRHGVEVLPAKYTDLGYFDDNDLAWIKSDKKYGVINSSGSLLIKPKYAWYSDATVINTEEQFITDDYILHGKKKKSGIYCVNVGGAVKDGNVTGGAFGYINSEGKEILPPKYMQVSSSFVDGAAWIRSGLVKYGYVNMNGEVIVKPKYGAALDMYNGIACVYDKGFWGYIDNKGNVLVPFKYTVAFPLIGDIAAVAVTTRNNGKKFLPKAMSFFQEYTELLASVGKPSNGERKGNGYTTKYGFIDRTGKEVIPLEYDNVSRTVYKGRALVCKGEKWAYIDKSGKLLTDFFITGFDELTDDYTRVLITGEYDDKNPVYNNFMNYDGKLLNDKIYANVMDFSEGYSCVRRKNGISCWIDKTGKECFDNGYTEIGDFSEGLAFASKDGVNRYINTKGEDEFIIPLGGDITGWKFKDGYAYVSRGDKYGCIDKNGVVIIPVELDSQDDVDMLFNNAYLLVKRPLEMRAVAMFRLCKDVNKCSIDGSLANDSWVY